MTEKKRTYHTAFIDGQEVRIRKGQTILDVARKEGIYIPTLCYLENLEPFGGCRLCAVEVDGMKGFPTACTTPVLPGMVVSTRSPELQKLRKEILEFTLSEHPFTCLVCKDKKECTDFMHTTRKVSTITGCNFCTSNGDCELQELVDYLELDDMKFHITYRGIPPVHDNPFYSMDYNLCVLCGRCVRICNEERNSHVLAFVDRGNTTIVGTAFSESQSEAGCEFCGACVDVCPTGSISEKIGRWRGNPDSSVKTTCVICPVACDMNVNTREGKVVQIGPRPGNRTNPPQLCLRGKFLPAAINDHPSRITTPLVKRGNKWVEVSWKEALEVTARKLEDHRGNDFGLIASGQDTLEDNYALQKFAREVMQSNNLDVHGSYPAKETPALIRGFHMDHAPASLDEIEDSGILLLLGLDASLSHPMLENRIRKAYKKGVKVISFGPHPTRTSTFVTTEMHYQPGEEEILLDLLLGILGKKSTGKKKPREALEISGITAGQLEQVRSLLSGSEEVILIAGDDLLRQPDSGDILRSLFKLHAAINTDRSCRMLFPGYEGNLFSTALMGVHPGFLPGFTPAGQDLPGMSCNEMIGQAGKKGVSALMLLGDLPTHPGLRKLDFLVQCNMFRTGASEYADVLLPVPDFLEIEGHLLSMEGKLKKVNRAVQKPGEVKSISWIVSELASAMGVPGLSRKPAELFRELKPFIDVDGRGGVKHFQVKEPAVSRKTAREKPGKDNAYPVRLMLRHNHFRYRGNRLTELVPDLALVTGEGALGLPDSLMVKLKVKEGDRVRIVSEHGEMDSVVCSGTGQNCQSACLLPNGDDPSGILDGIYPDRLVVEVKIEKA